MIARAAEKQIVDMARKFPVITLTGPRQSGKTTLSQAIFPGHTYISLENPDNKEFALDDPRGFLAQFNQKVIIDEAQNAPELFSYIQGIVDSGKIPGQFILTGSQNFLLMEKISQSLAGRTYIFHLLPLSLEELKPTKFFHPDLDLNILKGGYPRIYDADLQPDEFYPSYIQTYIERDMRQIINIQDLNIFKHFVKLCAGRTGQIVNTNAMGNQLGIDHKTVKRWLTVLETSFIIFQLPAWTKNFNKRIIKSPKLYFYDTGLACNLLGIKHKDDLQVHFAKGALFENFVVNELLKASYNSGRRPQLFFWQSNAGKEIDLIIEEGTKVMIAEIKSSRTVRKEFFKNIKYFQELTGNMPEKSFLFYGGEESLQRSGIKVVPWHSIRL